VVKEQRRTLIDCLRRSILAVEKSDLTDGQLLEEYLCRHDAAAVAALLQRHGPMVWGVCRRALANHHDAEDAFQATFLVLIRKAASIVPREMVGSWLHGVAHQTALKARALRAKRQARERQVKAMPEPQAVPEPDRWQDVQPLLDQELRRLPQKYRVAIILCDLEGKTRKEAARQLEVPEGTLSTRLRTARMMLAKRLARFGLALSGGALATMGVRQAASACVPRCVVSSTIKAVTLFAAGQAASMAAISVQAATLAEGVLKSMYLTKLKALALGLLLVAALGSGAGLIYQTPAAEPQQAPATSNSADREKQARDEGARPLGKIIRLTSQSDKVYISLGKEDKVSAKMTFRVFAAGISPVGHRPKATLEVETVISPHLSLARVTCLHDPDSNPLVQGDQLYRAGENAPKEQAVKLYNGDKDVQELIHNYRGLSDKDKLGQYGNRIHGRLLHLSQSEQVTLSPFTRDALAGLLAEHHLRQLLREAKDQQAMEEVKRAVELEYAKQLEQMLAEAVKQKSREEDAKSKASKTKP
jgi:RNA polymerase sigma factor (sigma-70 family)